MSLEATAAVRHAARIPPWARLARWDEALAGTALALMTLIPLVEIVLRPLLGRGVDLVEPDAVRNPYVLASINRHRVIIFSDERSLSV